jgi:hypothetical protein
MSWYAAHILMYVRLKDRTQDHYPLWENIVLVKAESEEDAFVKAEKRGREDEGDDDGSFRWAGEPATFVFAGVRKLTTCEDHDKRPNDGTEVSFLEMQVDSKEAIEKLLNGEPVSVRLVDKIHVTSSEL